MKRLIQFFLALILCQNLAAVVVTKVGNGDDGTDLENRVPLTQGPIVDARGQAVALLKKLNIPNIRGLSLLVPEIERSELFMVTNESRALLPSDVGNYHADLSGRVYARTLAHPHAPTRFFPIANHLNLDQLIALHVHEGLHRALPPEIRENEGVVAQITLAITSPLATHDQVWQTTEALLPVNNAYLALPADPALGSTTAVMTIGQSSHRSNIGLGFQQFLGTSTFFPIRRMYLLHSDLYPWGEAKFPLGVGIEGALLATDRGNFMGPLSLSARFRAFTGRDFDIGFYACLALSTFSADELKNSPFGRDIFTLGGSVRKAFGPFYVENYLGFTPLGHSGPFFYGNTFNAKIRGGYRIEKFDLGSFIEMHLSDFKLQSDKLVDYGRYHILSLGPEVSLATDNFSISLSGRFLIDASAGSNFDFLGNLLGTGVANGSLGCNVSFRF